MNTQESVNNKTRPKKDDDEEYIGFSIKNMDTRVNPLKNFYEYANGNWIRSHPVPPDKSSYVSFTQLYEKNQTSLKRILERSARSVNKDSRIERMCGDFYSSVMNTSKIEKLGLEPIKPIINEISNLKRKEDISKLIARLQLIGIFPFLGSESDRRPVLSMPDKKNSSIYAFYLKQGGISLPDRDYYLNKSFSEVMERYANHISKMFSLAGKSEKESKRCAKTVISIEKELAKASRTRAELRDEEKTYNKIKTPYLIKRYPHIRFDKYFEELGAPDIKYVIVGEPEFLSKVDEIIYKRDIEEVKNYLEWNVINKFAPYLSSSFEEENFNFFFGTLLGQKRMEPRWKKAVKIVDSHMGEGLGELFMKEYFPPESKKMMKEMVNDIKLVFKKRLMEVEWMSDKTKKLALKKFDRFRTKIGGPEHFQKYRSLIIKRDDLVGNIMRSTTYEIRRQIKRVGKKIDRKEWHMTPPTVNAYFDPSRNEIAFPAGILGPPFFDNKMDDAVNYGGIGGVIGHEITHGFDDQGRQYDMNGNLRNWWSKDDLKKFLNKAKQVIELYGSREPVKGFKVNGKLTLGENIADLGGIKIAFDALQRRLKKNPEARRNIDGLTPEQRFFISWANIWRESIREEELKRRLTIDPHSPSRLRGEIPVMNHPEFEKTFGGKGEIAKKVGVW